MPYSHFLPSYSGVAYFFVYEGLEEHPDGSRVGCAYPQAQQVHAQWEISSPIGPFAHYVLLTRRVQTLHRLDAS